MKESSVKNKPGIFEMKMLSALFSINTRDICGRVW